GRSHEFDDGRRPVKLPAFRRGRTRRARIAAELAVLPCGDPRGAVQLHRLRRVPHLLGLAREGLHDRPPPARSGLLHVLDPRDRLRLPAVSAGSALSPDTGRRLSAAGVDRHSRLQRGGSDRADDRSDPRKPLPAREARRRRGRRRIDRLHLGSDARSAGAKPVGRLRTLRQEPREARCDGRGNPPRDRRDLCVRGLRLRPRAGRACAPRRRLRRSSRRRGGRPRRRSQQDEQLAHPDATSPVLRGLPRHQGQRVAVRGRHMCIRLLLRLSPRRPPCDPRQVREPALPRPSVHLRGRPGADELRAAQLARHVPVARDLAHDRARASPPVRTPAAALEKVVASGIDPRLAVHLAQASAGRRNDVRRGALPVGGAGRAGALPLLPRAREREPALLPDGRLCDGRPLLPLLRRRSQEPALVARRHLRGDLHGLPRLADLLRAADDPQHVVGHARVDARRRRWRRHRRWARSAAAGAASLSYTHRLVPPRLRGTFELVLGLLMIPLSLVPIVLYLTKTPEGYLMYLRGRYALAAPATPGLDRADRAYAAAAFRRLPVDGVPVLVYHGIGRTWETGPDRPFVVSRAHFAAQMRTLQDAGFHAIDSADLVRFIRTGDRSLLPRRPVLITFDDGRTDAMLEATPILRATHLSA